MGRGTTLVENVPTGHRHDPATNLVHWSTNVGGQDLYFAMPEAAFREGTFRAMALIQQIDRDRRARIANDGGVVPIGRGKARKAGHRT